MKVNVYLEIIMKIEEVNCVDVVKVYIDYCGLFFEIIEGVLIKCLFVCDDDV